MMSKIRSRTILGLLVYEAPPFIVSLIIAELLFKFGSFTREALAFVALWYVLTVAHGRIVSLIRKRTALIPAEEQLTKSQ